MDSVQSAVSRLDVSTLKQLRNEKSMKIVSRSDIQIGDILFYHLTEQYHVVLSQEGEFFRTCDTRGGSPFSYWRYNWRFDCAKVEKLGTLGQDGKIVI